MKKLQGETFSPGNIGEYYSRRVQCNHVPDQRWLNPDDDQLVTLPKPQKRLRKLLRLAPQLQRTSALPTISAPRAKTVNKAPTPQTKKVG